MKAITLGLSLLAAAFSAQAQLVTFDFAGATTLPVAPATTATGVVVSGITKGPNILNVVPNGGVLAVGPGNSATNATNAVTLGQYFEFTVRAENGGKLNLGALVFLVRRETNDPLGWVVRSSVDNFSTNLGTADIPTVTPTFTSVGVTLPSADFTGLTGEVTFRIYTYATNLATFADYDNIQLIGTYTAAKAPQVSVFSARSVTTTKGKIRLKGNAYDDTTVRTVTVGNKVAIGTTDWAATVRLKVGTNRIRINAIDEDGLVSPTVTIRVKRVVP